MSWIATSARLALLPSSGPQPVSTITSASQLGQFNPAPSIAANNGFNWAQIQGVAPRPDPPTLPGFQINAFQRGRFQTGIPKGDPADLDQGTTDQGVLVSQGPSLGWVLTYVNHLNHITVPGLSVVNPGDGLIIVDEAVTGDVTLMLPSVNAWLQQRFGRPAVGFSRTLLIKPSAGNTRLMPAGLDQIDFVAGPVTITGPDLIRLYPTELGWIRG